MRVRVTIYRKHPFCLLNLSHGIIITLHIILHNIESHLMSLFVRTYLMTWRNLWTPGQDQFGSNLISLFDYKNKNR